MPNMHITLDAENVPFEYKLTDVHVDDVVQKMLTKLDRDVDAALDDIRSPRRIKTRIVVNDVICLGNRLSTLDVRYDVIARANDFYTRAMNGDPCPASEAVRIAADVLADNGRDPDLTSLMQSPAVMLKKDVVSLIKDLQIEAALLGMKGE